ncbi:MAG: hypothetical protein RR246_06615 [Clostridia bacterium]
MKRIFILILTGTLIFSLAACNGKTTVSESEKSSGTSSDSSKTTSNSEISKESSEKEMSATSSEVSERIYEVDINNQTHANGKNKMGDNDGPAFCVYSKPGFNKGSFDILFSKLKINNVRKSDGKNVNGYIFLGVDVLSEGNEYWINCFDTGFCYSGKNGGWHLFYNVYELADKNELKWYESKLILNPKHDYRLILDTSKSDEKATISVFDITDNKIVDKADFSVKGMKKDGSNTSYYQNFAFDYPENLIVGSDGKIVGNYDKGDWIKSTLYSTDEDLYIKNIIIADAILYKGAEQTKWNEETLDNIGIWPDAVMKEIDYPCVKIYKGEKHFDYRVDIDMNRH